MDESTVQILAIVVAILFWIVDVLTRLRKRSAQDRQPEGHGQPQGGRQIQGSRQPKGTSQEFSRETSRPAPSQSHRIPGEPAASTATPGAVSAAAGAKGGPRARAREAEGRLWRERVRAKQAREQRGRAVDLQDGIWDLSKRLQAMEERTGQAMAGAVSILRDQLEGIERDAVPGVDGSELERLTSALRVIETAARGIQVLSDARTDSHNHWLVVSDQVIAGLIAALPGLGGGPAVTLRRIDASWQDPLREVGLCPVVMPDAWTQDLASWPHAIQEALRDLLSASPLGHEMFDRVGLSETWVVPYSEPAYLSSAQVVGIYGPWLAALTADILAILLWGPAWARVVTRNLAAEIQDPFLVWARPSGLHIDRHPPAYLRLWALAAALDRLGRGSDADAVRRQVSRWAEPAEALLRLPTRRGTHYAVEMRPFLDAGKALVEFLWDEPFPALGERSLADLAQSSRWTEQGSLARALRHGTALGGGRDALLLVGAALEAWIQAEFDPRVSAGLAERSLRFLAPRKTPSRSAATTRPTASGATGGVTQDLLVEAVVLGTVLGPPAWACQAGWSRIWSDRPVRKLGRSRGRL